MSHGLSVHVLRITAEASEPILLDEHPGSALRGALFGALLRRFCANPTARTCAECPLNATCPVAALVAPLRDEAPRGRDVPRPFVLAPSPAFLGPVPETAAAAAGARRVAPAEILSFDVSLFGRAAAFFPYIALSIPTLETLGLGRRQDDRDGRRGRLHVRRVDAIDPFGDAIQLLYMPGQARVSAPTLAITADRVATRAAALPTDRLALRFLTPTRLIAEGQLVRRPDAAVLARRLAERLEALEREYGEPGDHGDTGAAAEDTWRARRLIVERHAPSIRTVTDETRWVDVASYSARQRRATPIGGFVGRAVFEGDLAPLRELLVWGEVLHAGKNAVKGDGLYRIEPP